MGGTPQLQEEAAKFDRKRPRHRGESLARKIGRRNFSSRSTGRGRFRRRMTRFTSEVEIPVPLALIPDSLTPGGLLRVDLPDEMPDVAPTDVLSIAVLPTPDAESRAVKVEGTLSLGQSPGDPAALHFYLTAQGVEALRPEGESRRYWKITSR